MRRTARAIIINDGKLLVNKRNKFGSQYFILIGGGVEVGESLEEALFREVHEESGVQIANPRLVFTENSGFMYGLQHIFLCDYLSGDPALHPDSAEAKISALGLNTYEPLWLPLTEVMTVPFRTDRLRRAILDGVQHGFPQEVVDITELYRV